MIQFLLAVLGGVALWFATSTGLWVAGFFAISLLWLAVRGRAVGAGFALGWCWGIAFFFPLVKWAAVSTGLIAAQVALAVVEGCYLGVVGAAWALLSRAGERLTRPWLRALAATAIFLAVEQLRGMWPYGGLPWGTLAFTFTTSPLVSYAPYGSTALVGGVAVLIGVLAAMTPSMSYLQIAASVVAALVLVIAPVILPVGARSSGSLNVAIVQGNVVPPGTQDRALAVTENHVRATRELVKASETKPDLILWPESSSDRDIRVDDAAGSLVFDMVADLGIPLVMGTQSYVEGGRYNDVLVIEPDGIADRYSKQHPVPFGEYIPHRELLHKITDVVDQVSTDMLPGTGKAQVELPSLGLRLAVPICFEVAYTDIVAEAVRGSQLLVIPTNNASFGTSELSSQQFSMTAFRAVETGRTAIQVSTSGISGVADHHGVVYETDLFTKDARVVQVALYDRTTFATSTAAPRRVIVFVLGALGAILAIGMSRQGRS